MALLGKIAYCNKQLLDDLKNQKVEVAFCLNHDFQDYAYSRRSLRIIKSLLG